MCDRMKGNLRFIKQKYYEQGNKANRMLAIRLRKHQSSNIVQKLKSDQTIISKPNEIADRFANCYKTLCKNTQTCKDDNLFLNYLSKITFNTLPEISAKQLHQPIQEQEISAAISSLKSNKSPGPDGFINEFYKIVLKAYHHALQTETVAPSWNYITIVVIHKEDKDPTKCQSYKPISLLNKDLRILTTIIAKRVNEIITEIINPDKTGFITGRHYGDNVWGLLKMMSSYKTKPEQAMVLSLDAQKANDQVSWQYLEHTLQKFKLGKKFIRWIQILYSNPMAAVKVNGTMSNTFPLERGCRQRCSLSPLLFIISIELLAQLIMDKENIQGFTINREQHKHKHKTQPLLKELIGNYGHFSGYKVNIDKTLAIDICRNISQTFKDQSGLPCTYTDSIRLKLLGEQTRSNTSEY
uniref:Reverse transcriptase domain-containing protein n=1 Tax=Oryzias melastigma TaxID=30732 RepID=A0A3B3C2S0_ORYME